jgi:hypothetical protein
MTLGGNRRTGIRRAFVAGIATLLLCTAATPAAAGYNDEATNAPVIFDVLIMRPVGFVALGLGTGLFVVALPIVAVSRPQDIGKPFDRLIVRPCRFLWGDRLGEH